MSVEKYVGVNEGDNSSSDTSPRQEEILKALTHNDPEANMLQRAFKNSKEEIFNEIIKQAKEKIKDMIPFTRGKEGEVYKVEIELRGIKEELLIVKRLYNKIAENEFQNQKDFFFFFEENLPELNIKAPAPIASFEDEQESFIVMEEVKGKTLYNLIWEGIINQVLIEDLNRELSSNENQRFDEWLQSFIEKYKATDDQESNGKLNYLYQNFDVSFENDTVAEDALNEFLELYNTIFSGNYTLEDIYRDNIYKISLFTDNSQNKISVSLRQAINYMNNNGYFHRDLGGNPRNIMFDYNGDIHIIDFGKSIIDSSLSSDTAYEDQFYGAEYDKDISIVTAYIDQLGGFDKLTNKQNKKDILVKNIVQEHFENMIKEGLGDKLLGRLDIEIEQFFKKISKKSSNIGENGLNMLKHELKDQIEERDKAIGDRKITKQPRSDRSIKSSKEGLEKVYTYLFGLNYDEINEVKEYLYSLEYEQSKIENRKKMILNIIDGVLNNI